jgi:hypothetical protein
MHPSSRTFKRSPGSYPSVRSAGSAGVNVWGEKHAQNPGADSGEVRKQTRGPGERTDTDAGARDC